MTDTNSGLKLLRVEEVAARVGYHRVYIYKLERAGRFPKRVHVGPNRVAWLEHEIDSWIRAKAEARGTALPTNTGDQNDD